MMYKTKYSLIAVMAVLILAAIGVSIAQVNENSTAQSNVSVNDTNINQTENLSQTNTSNQSANLTANATTDLENQTSENPGVNLYIMKWYPKGPDFVFVCNATGFIPTSYSWFYGDGRKLVNIKNKNTYHVYKALGNYTVMCSAKNGNVTVSDSLVISVESLVRPSHPLFGSKDQGREFACRNEDTNESAVCTCVNKNVNSASCKCS